ncbi:hypothetical protein C0J52_28030, partial [Blattella germanica]
GRVSQTKERKRFRTAFTRKQQFELERVFRSENYLAKHSRTILATTLNLTEQQIKIWFQNRRMKIKKEIISEGNVPSPRPNPRQRSTPPERNVTLSPSSSSFASIGAAEDTIKQESVHYFCCNSHQSKMELEGNRPVENLMPGTSGTASQFYQLETVVMLHSPNQQQQLPLRNSDPSSGQLTFAPLQFPTVSTTTETRRGRQSRQHNKRKSHAATAAREAPARTSPTRGVSTERLLIFCVNFPCLYLTEERRFTMATDLNLSEIQIKIWFQNR